MQVLGRVYLNLKLVFRGVICPRRHSSEGQPQNFKCSLKNPQIQCFFSVILHCLPPRTSGVWLIHSDSGDLKDKGGSTIEFGSELKFSVLLADLLLFTLVPLSANFLTTPTLSFCVQLFSLLEFGDSQASNDLWDNWEKVSKGPCPYLVFLLLASETIVFQAPRGGKFSWRELLQILALRTQTFQPFGP